MEDKNPNELQTEQETISESLPDAEVVELEEKEEASVEESFEEETPIEETPEEETLEEETLEEETLEEETSEEETLEEETSEEETLEEETPIEEIATQEEVEEPTEESSAEIVEEATVEEEVLAEESIAEESCEQETIAEETSDGEVAEEPTAQETPKEESAQVAPRGLVVQTWQLILALVVVVAMVVGGVLLGVLLGNRNGDDAFNGSPVDYDWELQHGATTNPNQITLPGYADLLFPADKKQIEMVLPNHKSNPCYLRYTLMLEETGEILYQSPLIAPGKAVLEIELSRILPIGDYHLIIAIDSVSLADGRTPMNGAEHRVLLQVR